MLFLVNKLNLIFPETYILNKFKQELHLPNNKQYYLVNFHSNASVVIHPLKGMEIFNTCFKVQEILRCTSRLHFLENSSEFSFLFDIAHLFHRQCLIISEMRNKFEECFQLKNRSQFNWNAVKPDFCIKHCNYLHEY